jgi:hypothetical protein
MRPIRTTIMIATASALALSLAACNKAGTPDATASADAANALPALPAAVPLQPGAATAMAPAPAVQALPVQHAVRVARLTNRSDAYAYLDRAQGVTQAIGDAPPDYTYDDGDVSPWVWQTSGGDRRYAEPIDGGYRYYYYQAGSDTPYLVRDPQYSYAYSGPQLVAVYDSQGSLLPPDYYGERVDYASRYYDRAAYLYDLSREREHRGVIAANWAERRAEIAASRAQWAQDMAEQAEWRAYHDAHEAQEQAHWAAESERRAMEAQQFARWQQVGFRSPPPQPVVYAPPPPPQPQPRFAGWLPHWFDGDGARQAAMQQQRQQQQQQAFSSDSSSSASTRSRQRCSRPSSACRNSGSSSSSRSSSGSMHSRPSSARSNSNRSLPTSRLNSPSNRPECRPHSRWACSARPSRRGSTRRSNRPRAGPAGTDAAAQQPGAQQQWLNTKP